VREDARPALQLYPLPEDEFEGRRARASGRIRSGEPEGVAVAMLDERQREPLQARKAEAVQAGCISAKRAPLKRPAQFCAGALSCKQLLDRRTCSCGGPFASKSGACEVWGRFRPTSCAKAGVPGGARRREEAATALRARWRIPFTRHFNSGLEDRTGCAAAGKMKRWPHRALDPPTISLPASR